MSREDKDKVIINKNYSYSSGLMHVQILAIVIWTGVIDPDKISIIFFTEYLITNSSVLTNLPSLLSKSFSPLSVVFAYRCDEIPMCRPAITNFRSIKKPKFHHKRSKFASTVHIICTLVYKQFQS